MPAAEPKTIVVPIVAGIGNALMAAPMVREIKRRLPAARVVVLARTKQMAEVFRRLPETDEVIVTGGGAKNLFKQIRLTRKLRPDAYVIPFPSNRWEYALLALTSGAKRKILHRYPVGKWSALGIIPFDRIDAVRGIHDVEQNVNLVDALATTAKPQAANTGEPNQVLSPRFALADSDRAAATQTLVACGFAVGTPFIVVHAGSAQTILAQAKRWPPEKYAALIEALHARTALEIVLLEGPDEAGVAESITTHCTTYRPHVVPLRGRLGDAGALLQAARLYVGSDSGLAHLAAAVGTRAVTLFAPADPDRVCPYGNRDLVVQTPCPCAPCFLYPWQATKPALKCAPPFCIEQITVESVVERAVAVVI